MSDSLFNGDFSAQNGVTKEEILEAIQENKVNHTNISNVAGDLHGILADIRDLMHKANGRANINLVISADGAAELVAVPVGFPGQTIYGAFSNSAEYNAAYEKLSLLVEGISTIDSFFNDASVAARRLNDLSSGSVFRS